MKIHIEKNEHLNQEPVKMADYLSGFDDGSTILYKVHSPASDVTSDLWQDKMSRVVEIPNLVNADKIIDQVMAIDLTKAKSWTEDLNGEMVEDNEYHGPEINVFAVDGLTIKINQNRGVGTSIPPFVCESEEWKMVVSPKNRFDGREILIIDKKTEYGLTFKIVGIEFDGDSIQANRLKMMAKLGETNGENIVGKLEVVGAWDYGQKIEKEAQQMLSISRGWIDEPSDVIVGAFGRLPTLFNPKELIGKGAVLYELTGDRASTGRWTYETSWFQNETEYRDILRIICDFADKKAEVWEKGAMDRLKNMEVESWSEVRQRLIGAFKGVLTGKEGVSTSFVEDGSVNLTVKHYGTVEKWSFDNRSAIVTKNNLTGDKYQVIYRFNEEEK
jgi:hypothetical protein